jgi:hypothetical protein
MKARGRLAVLFCAAALLALPASVAAKPGYVVDKALRISVVSLPGSGGYSVSVVGVNRRLVGVSVSNLTFSKGASYEASATYIARERAADERIDGHFGSRGSVSVRFEPEGPPEANAFPSSCKTEATRQEGRFIGTIRFEGENGFARARASTARGFVIRRPRAVCKRRFGDRDLAAPETPPGTSLSALSSRYPRAPWFSVLAEEPSRPRDIEGAEYNAGTVEKRRGMRIYRSARAITLLDTFAVTPLGHSPATATVEPPAPFSGTATYEKRPGGEISWSGDLAVDLPGRGKVSLADSTYRAKLCRSLACACPIGECSSVSVSAGSSGSQASTAAAPTPSPWRWPGSPR